MPPNCLANAKDAMPVPSPAAPRPTLRAFAPREPTNPPTIPPRPKSKLGDRLALKVIEDVKRSLVIATTVLRLSETSVDAVTLPPPPRVWMVEKVPTPAVIVPVERRKMLALLALKVEMLIVLRVTLSTRAKVETARVETAMMFACICPVILALMVFIVLKLVLEEFKKLVLTVLDLKMSVL
jgi:hypothetical protein